MMNVKLINKGTEGELLLEGRLDSNTAPEVEKIAMDVANRFNSVILNLGGLEYTSSAGLRVILKLRLAMEKKAGSLVLKAVTPAVMEVLELTGFAGILNFVD